MQNALRYRLEDLYSGGIWGQPSGAQCAVVQNGNVLTHPLDVRHSGLLVGDFAGGAANLAADFADLVCEVSLDHFSPDTAAFAIFIRAFCETGQLLAPLPDEGVKSHQFRFQFDRLALLAFHYLQCARAS
jgi:hypothetical protein